ncbi:MAG: hypothetical protein JNM14_00535 [Ferruginibacter sp.]|nr:hypothetical protein [Ferruginibacter sp.]
MKHVLLLSFLSMGILSVNSSYPGKNKNLNAEPNFLSIGSTDGSQPEPESERMPAAIFRSQDACRVELKDFVFDVEFKIVSATVYFSGTNFKNVETGFIKSKDLKPIKNLMSRCAPGTMVVFDNVKVIGPDNLVRTIQGTSYLLR